MKWISRYFEWIILPKNSDSPLRASVWLFVIYIFNQLILVATIAPIGDEFLQHQTTMDPRIFFEIKRGWNNSQLTAYRNHFVFDWYHPLIYSLALVYSFLYLFQKLDFPRRKRWFVLLPVLSGFCDFCENVIHYYLLK